MEKYNYIIWDWNGTLFNDAELCLDIMNQLLDEYNKPRISFKTYRKIFNFPLINYYRDAGHDITNGNFEKIGAEFIEYYEKRKFEADLHSDATDILNFFKEAGKKQFMLSAYTHEHLQDLLKHYKIDHYFEQIQGNDNIYADGKLELARKMIDQIGNPDSILMIGDTLHDLDIANEFGVDIVISSAGHQSSERFIEKNVRIVDRLLSLKGN